MFPFTHIILQLTDVWRFPHQAVLGTEVILTTIQFGSGLSTTLGSDPHKLGFYHKTAPALNTILSPRLSPVFLDSSYKLRLSRVLSLALTLLIETWEITLTCLFKGYNTG